MSVTSDSEVDTSILSTTYERDTVTDTDSVLTDEVFHGVLDHGHQSTMTPQNRSQARQDGTDIQNGPLDRSEDNKSPGETKGNKGSSSSTTITNERFRTYPVADTSGLVFTKFLILRILLYLRNFYIFLNFEKVVLRIEKEMKK